MAALALAGSVASAAVPAGHGAHPPMPAQKFAFRCVVPTKGEPTIVEVALKLVSPTMPAEPAQTVELPAPLPPIVVSRYLPQAVLDQSIRPEEGAPPAVLLSIDGPTQHYQRWLLAGDPDRNRLTSFIASWRYMAVRDKAERDELFGLFERELTRDPQLIISRLDGRDRQVMPLAIGARQTVDALACRLRVRSFYHDYALDDKTRKPVNRSDKRFNPAILVGIEHDGRTEERWVFRKTPDFQADRADRLPYRVLLDCPLDRKRPTPDFALVTLGRAKHEVWLRHEGKRSAHPIALEERREVVGSQYTFHVQRFVPAGRLVERYLPSTGRGAVSALQVELTEKSGERVTRWLELGKPAVIPSPVGPLEISFGPATPSTPARGLQSSPGH